MRPRQAILFALLGACVLTDDAAENASMSATTGAALECEPLTDGYADCEGVITRVEPRHRGHVLFGRRLQRRRLLLGRLGGVCD